MKSEEEFFVIFTKYGFIHDVFGAEEESNDNFLLSNVTFTKSPKSAMRIEKKGVPAPTFARSLSGDSSITVDKWVSEIDGFLIKCKEQKISEESFDTGFYERNESSHFQVLDNYHFNRETNFESFEPVEEEGCC